MLNKCLRITLLFGIIFSSCFGQFNEWVWMHGHNTFNQPGVYGTQGIPNAANMPPQRYEAGEWDDGLGNFWIFGGGTVGNQVFNDLWKYDPATNQWTWMKGSNLLDQAATYGTQGIPAAANNPGGREFAPSTWTDNNGNLWLFGGNGYDGAGLNGNLSDLWRYDPITNNWTWMKGPNTINQSGVYGTIGVANPANYPGARNETSCTWTDSNGKLWLFGGQGYDVTGNVGSMNDLWMYDPLTNDWTWMSGSTTRNQSGVYGVQGVAAPGNVPGGRIVYASWIDDNDRLWLFGGAGRDGVGANGYLNDLWMYDIATGLWTWVDGSNLIGQNRPYGTKCIPAPGNGPSARIETRARWKDECGNFWLMGGSIQSFGGFSNDLWKYNPNTNLWTWVSGDNVTFQFGVYGTQGVPSPANKPGSRCGTNSFVNQDGFWIFGGLQNFGFTNDLWRYMPDKPIAQFSPDTTNGCFPLTVNFTDLSSPNCNEIKSYAWDFGDPGAGASNNSTLANPSYTYTTSGNFSVKLVVRSCTGSLDSITQSITVFPKPILTSSTDTTICNGNSVNLNAGGAVNYSWYPSGGLSSTNGNSVTASPTTNTTYTVVGFDGNTCSDTTTIDVEVLGLPLANNGNDTSICIGASVSLSASGGSTYSWSTGETTSLISVSPSITTVYSTTVSNGTCADSSDVTVIVNPLPIAEAGSDLVIVPGGAVTLSATGAGSCTWSPPNGLSCTNCCEPNASPDQTTTYYVSVTDTNGCTSLDSVIVYVSDIYVPNAFSPNGDGNNDVLTVNGFGVEKMHFIIFNRWGEVVFETNNIGDSWDGTFRGKPLNTAVFVYQLNATLPGGTELIRKGNISLIR